MFSAQHQKLTRRLRERFEGHGRGFEFGRVGCVECSVGSEVL